MPHIGIKRKVVVPEPYKGLTLPGQIAGYRTLTKEVHLPNDGDVPTGLQIQFIRFIVPIIPERCLYVDGPLFDPLPIHR